MRNANRSKEVLEYLKKFYSANDRMPTHKEMEIDLKINRGSMSVVFTKLVEQGITQGFAF